MFRCNICEKTFASGTTLKRHVESLYLERTKFQCWYCNKVYARKENAVKQTQMKHNDYERKFMIIETTNTKFNPGIFKPDPWVPPPETRPRSGNIHTILIKPKTQQTTTHTASTTWDSYSLSDIDRSFQKISPQKVIREDSIDYLPFFSQGALIRSDRNKAGQFD